MIWVAEYSTSQDSFHIQPLADALKANLRRALVKNPNDWVPLAVGGEEEVKRAVEMIRQGQARLHQGRG